MNKVFLTTDKVEVRKGYLSAVGKEMSPVTNESFVTAQKQAEYVIALAEAAKGKNFEDKEGYSIIALKEQVRQSLAAKKTKFVADPKEPKMATKNKLAEEALAFIGFTKDKDKVNKINDYLAQFEIVSEFEEVGLFFDQGIVKLDKIYTMNEIIDAVTETVDLLD